MLKRRERREGWVSEDVLLLSFLIAKDPDSLQNVNISVISKTNCRNAYKSYDITKSMLCLGIVPGRRRPCKVSYSQYLPVPILFPCLLSER